MKISMIAPETRTVPPLLGGGVETWIYETSKRLAPNDIYIICPQAQLQSIEITNSITYIRVKTKSTLPLMNAFASRFFPSLYFYPYTHIARTICKKLSPSIIHIHNRPQFLKSFHKHCECRTILHMHNEIKPYLPIINPLAVNLLNKADAIISVSKYLKKSILKKYPQVDPSKVYVLYNGSDVERFRPRNEEKLVNIRKRYGISANTNVILYVGRLIPEKGVHLLVNSFPFIKKDYNNVKLLIVGAPNFAVASETAYAHLLKANADKDVIFTGWIPEDILPYMYSLSDIFVFPAIWNDVSPLPIYEAQASGLPVISSNRGGIPEIIINNETGIIIEPNVKNLTDAVLALLHDESKRKKMGVNARKRAEEYYSWDRVATELQKIYRDIL